MPHSLDPLFDVYPEWRGRAQRELREDGLPFDVLEVKAPDAANVNQGLVVDTSNDEISVGFDFYHSHFNDWVGDDPCFGTMAALEFINQIVSERVAVLSWWKGEKWCGSNTN